MYLQEIITDWIRPVEEPVLWICSPPRSGGTLLLRLLDSHPQLHNYPSVFGFNNEKMIWPHPEELQFSPNTLLEGIFERMSLYKFHRVGLRKQSSNMIQERYPIYFDNDVFYFIFEKYFEYSQNGREEFNALFTALFNSWRNYQSLYFLKQFIVGHTTMRWSQLYYYKENFNNFFSTYPDGYYLFMIRQPDDWMASYTHLNKATSYTGDPYDAAEFYKYHYKEILSLMDSQKVIILNFLDLVLRPEQTLDNLAQKLNIFWDPLLLCPTFNGAQWYPNSSFERGKKAAINSNVIGEGKHLTGKEKDAVDNEMWELYHNLSEFTL